MFFRPDRFTLNFNDFFFCRTSSTTRLLQPEEFWLTTWLVWSVIRVDSLPTFVSFLLFKWSFWASSHMIDFLMQVYYWFYNLTSVFPSSVALNHSVVRTRLMSLCLLFVSVRQTSVNFLSFLALVLSLGLSLPPVYFLFTVFYWLFFCENLLWEQSRLIPLLLGSIKVFFAIEDLVRRDSVMYLLLIFELVDLHNRRILPPFNSWSQLPFSNPLICLPLYLN